jgi:serine phosphatase RsbU (regulator of sigma subunit)
MKAILENATKSSREIEESVIKSLYEFSGSDDINDDYTAMTVKFK